MVSGEQHDLEATLDCLYHDRTGDRVHAGALQPCGEHDGEMPAIQYEMTPEQ